MSWAGDGRGITIDGNSGVAAIAKTPATPDATKAEQGSSFTITGRVIL